MSDNKSYADSGILNYDRAYHFIKKIVNDVIDSLGNSIQSVPAGKVLSENKPGDSQSGISIQNFDETTTKTAKPASYHFISVPTVQEYVPIFNDKGSNTYYGNPLPIFDSLQNNSKAIPTSTDRFIPDLTKNPIQITPGDVVVQGRYGNNLMFSDMKGYPTFRLVNSMRSRENLDRVEFNRFTPEYENQISEDVSMPIFYNPNVDGSSFYMLTGGTPPGVDLDSETVLAKTKRFTKYKNKVLAQTFRDNQIGVSEKLFMSSDSIMFYTKGLNRNAGHDISMLSSGNIFLNSFRNVFITTPDVTYHDTEEEIPEGRISLGSHRDPGTSPNAIVQPVVRGLNYQETIEDILDTLKFITDNFKNLADGGVAVDKDGSAITGDAQQPIINLLNDKIDGIKKKLINDLSKKVFTT